jgi:lipoprotein NlpD
MNRNCVMAGGASAALWVSALLVGCGVVSPTHDAPIVERSKVPTGEVAAASNAPAPDRGANPTPTREAHDGAYVVQTGDTLYSIALAFGQDFRDIARWNNLDDPTQVHVGQTLRVAAPAPEESAAAAAEAMPVPITASGAVEMRPLAPADVSAPAPEAQVATRSDADHAGDTSHTVPAEPAPAPARSAAVEPEGPWVWPGAGKLLERFDETHNKGIQIAGSIGDPVWAANDGQVVYSGNSLRGYGNLVIIKHTDDFVSVYAHNNEILVTQGQQVKRGQRIAGLGMTDAPTPRLDFEIRRRGKPVDPLTYLPSR